MWLEAFLLLLAIALVIYLNVLMFGIVRREIYRYTGPVNSRAPGLSEHASSFGQTEARAKRTIERPPDKPASAHECGAALPPRAPEPSAARVG